MLCAIWSQLSILSDIIYIGNLLHFLFNMDFVKSWTTSVVLVSGVGGISIKMLELGFDELATVGKVFRGPRRPSC